MSQIASIAAAAHAACACDQLHPHALAALSQISGLTSGMSTRKSFGTITSAFIMDVLDHHKLPPLMHRLPGDQQEQLLAGRTDELFRDLPDRLTDFYRNKIENLACARQFE